MPAKLGLPAIVIACLLLTAAPVIAETTPADTSTASSTTEPATTSEPATTTATTTTIGSPLALDAPGVDTPAVVAASRTPTAVRKSN